MAHEVQTSPFPALLVERTVLVQDGPVSRVVATNPFVPTPPPNPPFVVELSPGARAGGGGEHASVF